MIGKYFTKLKGTQITAGEMKEIEDIDGEIRIFAGGKTMVNAKLSKIKNGNIINEPAVLVQSRGLVDVIYYDKPFTFKNEMWAYTSDNQITVRYLYYYLKTKLEVLREKAGKMGSLPQISLNDTEKMLIRLPTIERQKEIVSILDKFDSYCDNLSEGLPSEIEMRQKQYEYYRDKLLDFKKS